MVWFSKSLVEMPGFFIFIKKLLIFSTSLFSRFYIALPDKTCASANKNPAIMHYNPKIITIFKLAPIAKGSIMLNQKSKIYGKSIKTAKMKAKIL